MKKLIVGVGAIGVVLALRPLVKRRALQKMRDHCSQMAAHCKEMMESDSVTAGYEAAQHREDGEPVAAA